MKMQSIVVCTGMKQSEGEMEGKKSSSTTFHLAVDVAENSWGKSLGSATRPFKFGDASEFFKWEHLKSTFASAGAVLVACTFDVVTGADNSTKLVLLDIKPAPVAKG